MSENLTTPTGLICFDVTSRLNRVDVDLRSIAREFDIGGREPRPEELVRIARRHGFKAKQKRASFDQIAEHYPLPVVACRRDGAFLVILRADREQGKALIFLPETKKTELIGYEDTISLDIAEFIIMTPRLFQPRTVFGFRWFLQEILRFKKIIGEVLLGSFVVQLFGLVTPLFTQVILDKVIVHRSLTTLEVLATAFVAVTLLELLLNVSRNYIFTHVAAKLDAKLGANLFRHLLALPFMYFETRKVGNIAARVRELDTIREFLTNKAVSVCIDLFSPSSSSLSCFSTASC